MKQAWNRLLKLSNPIVELLEKGGFYRSIFKALYWLNAISFLIVVPTFLTFQAAMSDLFSYDLGIIIWYCVLFIITVVFSLILFSFWLNKKDQLNEVIHTENEFFIIPAIAHYIRSSGESFGIWMLSGNFILGILVYYVMGEETSFIFQNGFGLSQFLPMAKFLTFLSPIFGVVVILLSRFFAETISAIAAIANNTGRLKRVTAV
ncbi:MAG TPA: hypothetical protein VJ894_03485, partial [Cryomorphaceae bacterium]|nr:hypothetical protein [Cryomorphaceae bacterium]